MNKFDLKEPIICEDIKELTSLMELFGYDVDESKTTYSLLSNNFIYGYVKKIKCKTYEEYKFFIGNFKSKWV